jgi:hypothetical protein
MATFTDVVIDDHGAAVVGANVIVRDTTGATVATTSSGLGGLVTFSATTGLYTLDVTIGSRRKVQQVAVDDNTVFTPEMFGATGDGATNDTIAFQRLAAVVTAANGGVIELTHGATYLVGRQMLTVPAPATGPDTAYTYVPQPILELIGISGDIIIRGNGAKMKAISGYRYGTFDPAGSGAVYNPSLPYFGTGIAAGYKWMVKIDSCSGNVSIENLELDGNVTNVTLGGQWGDSGRQLPGSGLGLYDNTGRIIVNGVYSHDHPLDGGIGSGPGIRGTPENVTFNQCRWDRNGRNNFSLVGGVGWVFNSNFFTRSGRDIPVVSAPFAGIDLESEGGRYVDKTSFYDCTFGYNGGPGLLADQGGNTQNITCQSCRFIGSQTWSMWVSRPGARMLDCEIVGAMVGMCHSSDPTQALQCHRCTITDDVTRSTEGTVYTPNGLLIDTGQGFENVLFDSCNFIKTKAGTSTNGDYNGLLIHNCSLTETGTGGFSLYGKYSGGRTVLTLPNGGAVPTGADGHTDAGNALDPFILNGVTYPANIDQATGKKVYFGQVTYDPPSLAIGAKTTIQTMTVTGVALADKIAEASFSVNLAGAALRAWVSAADTVSFYIVNENGANPLDLASGTVRVKAVQA